MVIVHTPRQNPLYAFCFADYCLSSNTLQCALKYPAGHKHYTYYHARHAEGDNDDSHRCCKCCTPPDAAGKKGMCRTFFYILLFGTAGIAVFLGIYGLAESKRQGEAGETLVTEVRACVCVCVCACVCVCVACVCMLGCTAAWWLK